MGTTIANVRKELYAMVATVFIRCENNESLEKRHAHLELDRQLRNSVEPVAYLYSTSSDRLAMMTRFA